MSHSRARIAVGGALAAALLAAPIATPPAFALTVSAVSPGTSSVIIDEVYLSGGSAGAAFKNKFVELYNSSDSAVSLDGWSLQYRSGSGTGSPNATALTGTIPAKGNFLIQGASNSASSTARDLPKPDQVAPGFNPSGTTGTIVLSRQAAPLANLGTGSQVEPDNVADLLGYGSSNTFETTVAPAPASNSDVKSISRTDHADTNDNGADFTLSTEITPRSSTGEVTPPEPTNSPAPSDGTIIAIRDIQGTGPSSPMLNTNVTTRGKVTARYASGGMNGYFIQTPGTGGDLNEENHKASDAVFIYSPATASAVKIGDYVQVTGLVEEYYEQTQIRVESAKDLEQLTDASEEVKATPFRLPASEAFKESLEGMLLSPQGDFTVADNYSTNQYGELLLAAGTSPLPQPNAIAPYGTAENAKVRAENLAKSIKLDDGATTNFLSNATTKALPAPYLSNSKPVRVGAQATFTSPVVLGYSNSSWKFQPLEQLTPSNADTVQPVTFSNTRQDVPNAVGGDLKIASFNVLNYFPTTGDSLTGCNYYTDREGNPITVKDGCDARGAANAASFKRQQDKIVAAINASGADVVTLMEIENSAKFGKNRDDALSKLVAALNVSKPDVWDYVHSPSTLPALADEDVIRTAFIYKKAVAAPVGESVIHNDTKAFFNARKPLAQVFKPVNGSKDQEFIAIANHFKSKGSGVNGDTDKGQGASNLARVAQAESLRDFAKEIAESKGTDKVFLIGDFNSYAKEDPLNVLAEAGYVNQDEKAKNSDGTQKHSYLFKGEVGSLDHILASPAADKMVNGADIWNINSVEPIAMEYSRYNNNAVDFYAADQFRSSDHDPVVVGLNTKAPSATKELNFLGINDFHGRIDTNTVNFAGTIEKLRQESGENNTAFVSAGDNIGASLFASSVAKDQPSIDVLNALKLDASAVGNHEFDRGWADLKDRVIDDGKNAKFAYLGANVYKEGTEEPVLPEYTILNVNGVKVAVIGTVTKDVDSLVTPDGIRGLKFGDPVEAVNRAAAKIKAEKSADIIVAEFHEGASAGTPDGATIQQEVEGGGAFADIVTKTSPDVSAIFTGHTHKEYAWDAPITGQPGKTRPIVQTGSYGANVGQIQLMVDASNSVVTYKSRNVARTKDTSQSLIEAFPRVAEVDGIVKKALEEAAVVGNQPIGKVTKDITTAFTKSPETGEPMRDDRSSESTLGNLVADSILSSLSAENLGGAEIGVVNSGGLRNELYYGEDGTVTYAQANAVLPFVNNLWTVGLTGAQFKTLLEQQWQTNADGSPATSRPYQQLGLSKNVNYTYDPSRAQGEHITGIWIDGKPIDESKSYRIGAFNFLTTGGDNYRVFKEGTGARDSGLVDRDAWMTYLKEKSPLSPDFARRSVAMQLVDQADQARESLRSLGLSATAKSAAPEFNRRDEFTLEFSKLDLTSLGSPTNDRLELSITDSAGKTFDVPGAKVSDGAARVSGVVPTEAAAGDAIVTAKVSPSGTVARLAIRISDVTSPTEGPTTDPTDTPTTDPTDGPTTDPTEGPTTAPTTDPTEGPTTDPSSGPTDSPSNTSSPGHSSSQPATQQPGATHSDSTTDPATPGQGLASTGASPATMIALLSGLVVIGAGILLIVVGRRKRGAHL